MDTEEPQASSSICGSKLQQPSLQRLHAIQDEDNSFQHKLAGISAVIELPTGVLDSETSCFSQSIPTQRHHTRLEWVLRWLLDKLQSEKEVGYEARTAPQAWRCLRIICQSLPKSRVVHQLISYKILSGLGKALGEASSMFEQTKKDENSATLETKIHLGKRKRPSDSDGESGHFVDSAFQRPLDLFLALVAFLESFNTLFQHHGHHGEVNAQEQIKSIARGVDSQAPSILRNWLLCINHIFQNTTVSPPKWIMRSQWNWIQSILPIWESQRHEASITLFYRTSLVPASMVLATLTNTIENLVNSGNNLMDSIEPDISVLRATLVTLEQLLAKCFFRPVLSRALGLDPETPQKALDTSTAVGAQDESKLESIIERLDLILSRLSEATNDNSHDSLVSDLVREAVPRLLDISIRSFNTSTTAKQNKMWLEAPFVSLCHCLGVLQPPDAPSSFQQDSLLLLEKMLAIISLRKGTLTTRTLGTIIERYSGIVNSQAFVSGDQPGVRWSLVGAVLDLDADVFLPIESIQRQRSVTQQMIPEALLEHLSKSEELLNSIDEAKISTSLTTITSRATLIERIVTPLMHAYAQRRMLDKFWHALLRHCQNAYSSFGLAYLQNEDDCPSGWLLWEDARVASALIPLIERQLTPTQVSVLLDSFLDPISAMIQDQKDKTNDEGVDLEIISSVSARLLLIKLLLEGVDSADYQDQLSSQLLLLQSKLLDLLQIQICKTSKARWLVWRILSRIHLVLSHSQSFPSQQRFEENSNEASPVELAISDYFQQPGRKLNYAAAYEGLSLLASFLQYETLAEHLMPQMNEQLQLVATSVADSFSATDTSTSTLRTIWDGQPQGVETPKQLALASLCVFIRYPAIFERLDSTNRKDLFRVLYDAKVCFERGQFEETGAGVSLVTLWGSLEAYAVHDAPPGIRNEFLDTLSLHLDSTSSHDCDPFYPYGENISISKDYQRIPLVVLKRSRREQVLNSVSEYLVREDGKSRPPTVLRQCLSLMLRLMQIPNATADISTNAMTLWKIAKVIDDAGDLSEFPDLNDPILELFEELASLVLRHHLSTIDQSRTREYLVDHHRHAMTTVLQEGISELMKPGNSKLLTVTFAMWDDLKENLTFMCSGEERKVVTKTYLGKLREIFQAGSTDSFQTFRRAAFQAAFVAMLRLPETTISYCRNQDSNARESLEILERSIQEWLAKSLEASSTEADHGLQVIAFRALAKCRASRGENIDIETASILLERDLGIRDRLLVLDAFRDGLQGVDMESKYTWSQRLLSLNEEPSNNNSSLLRVLITSLEFEKEPPPSTSASSQALLPPLCKGILKLKDIQTFSELSDCILLILREKHWLVSQHSFDSVISTLIEFNGSNGPRLPERSCRLVYRRLCDIVHASINRHRAKFGGRFHILLPLLTALLDALFLPEVHSYTPRMRKPPWLTHGAATFDAEEGAAFANLLTSLCEPTVSSVTTRKSQRGNTGLIDETRKARAYAGQYVQDVLMEFCRAQLNGRLRTEVRKRLMPGLYAVIGVASEDGLRAMNASMDPSTRALWKSLYDDWRRFGVSKER